MQYIKVPQIYDKYYANAIKFWMIYNHPMM